MDVQPFTIAIPQTALEEPELPIDDVFIFFDHCSNKSKYTTNTHI
jgi:hypothetical protein